MNCDVCRGSFTSDQLVPIGGKNVCAKCKPDVVMNLKSGVGAAPRIDPIKAKEIKERISRCNTMSFVLAVPGIFLQGFAAQASKGVETPGLFLALQAVGLLLVLGGFIYYAKMKGRSGALALLALLSCLGLIILHFLSKTCQNCGASAGHAAKSCSTCGGPT